MALMKLAVRNLRRNRRRSLITLAALILGVTALVGFRGFMIGMRHMILENQMLGTLGAVQVHRAGYVGNVLGSPLTLDLEDTPALRAKIAAVKGVAAVTPRIEFGGMLATPDKKPPPDDGSLLPEADQGTTTFLVWTALDPALEQQVTPRKWVWVHYGRGEMLKDPAAAQIVINENFATSLGAPVQAAGAPPPPLEQMLAVLAPDRDGSLNGENVVVAGTFASMTPNDRRVGWMPLAVAQRLLRMEGRVTEYAVALQPGATPEEVRDALASALGPQYEAHTWDQRMPFVHDMVNTQDRVFGIISSIFLLVVLLGIVNAMLMSVLERVREIGTMLAVGMRRHQIARLFLAEGLVMGLVGGGLGVVLGWALVQYMGARGLPIPAPGAIVPSMVRPSVDGLFLLRALAQAVLGSALAALWPALRASRLRPVEALAST